MESQPASGGTVLGYRARSIWAKSWPLGVLDDQLETWLPLYCHLNDASAMASHLWTHWIPAHLRALIATDLHDSMNQGRDLLRFLAGIHDVGKASPAFAVQVRRLADDIRDTGMGLPYAVQGREQARHELAGAFMLMQWLTSRHGFAPVVAEQFAAIIGGHHGVPPDIRSLNALRGATDWLGDELWQEVQNEILDHRAQESGALELLTQWRDLELSQPAQIALTGLVVLADWMSSNNDFMPLVSIGRQPSTLVEDAESRVKTAWRKSHLATPWCPKAPLASPQELFATRFPTVGKPARPVQEQAASLAREMDPHGVLIIEAGMGEGKTEAALMAAEILAHRAGMGGVMVALPTQATANSIYTRLINWVSTLDAGQRTVHLVHGKAWLNEEFQQLRATPVRSTVAADEASDADTNPGSRKNIDSVATANRWLSGRYRASLAEFVVSTIDQVLFGALRTKYLAMRHLAMASKVVVLDEVHAVDVYMSVYLEKALEWLGAYGVPVIVLSATLPQRQRQALLDAHDHGRQMYRSRQTRSGAINKKDLAARSASARSHVSRSQAGVQKGMNNQHSDPPLDVAYPVITASGENGALRRELEPSGRSNSVVVSQLDDSDTALVTLLKEKLRDGGCALVIRNTVGRVQTTTTVLANAFGEENVTVAHARFLAVDRVEKDKALVDEFGKDATHDNGKRPKMRIVVASQVVEQSLDVDFDLLVTDIAPVDLVLQRLGRQHRHPRDSRPAPLRTPQAFITGFADQGDSVEFGSGISMVYEPYLLIRALDVLSPHLEKGTAIRLPEDIAVLVQTAYSDDESVVEKNAHVEWQEQRRKARATRDSNARKRRQAAKAFVLGKVKRRGEPITGLIRGNVGSVDETPEGSAQVRDGGDSIEVIVATRDAGGQLTIPPWIADKRAGQAVAEDLPIDEADAHVLAQCTLRLPYSLCHPGVFDEVIADLEKNWIAGWQSSFYLKGELVLILDEHCHAVIADHDLLYSPTMGLEVTKR